MSNPEPREHSVLFALRDLKAMEAERVSEADRQAAIVEKERTEAAARLAAEAGRVGIADETRRIEVLRAEAAVLAARTEAARAEAAREQRRSEQRLADAHEAAARLADDQRALRRLLGAEPSPPASRSWMWPATLAIVAVALGGAAIAWSLRPVAVAEARPPAPIAVAPPAATPPPPTVMPPPPRFEVAVTPFRPKRPRPLPKPSKPPAAGTSVLEQLELCHDDPTCGIR